MCIFLSPDNKIIYPHLNHLLKSYYYTTGYSVFAYDAKGKLLDKVVRSELANLTPWLNHMTIDKILHQLHYPITHLDSLLLELADDLYTIVAPVFVENRLTSFLLLEPFFIEQMSTLDKKKYYQRFNDNASLSLSYQTIKVLMYIHRDRHNYLGQLFYHLMSNSTTSVNNTFSQRQPWMIQNGLKPSPWIASTIQMALLTYLSLNKYAIIS